MTEEAAAAAEARDLVLAARNLLADAERAAAAIPRPSCPSTLVEAEAWRIETRLAESRVRSYRQLVATFERTAEFLGVDLLDPRLDPR